MLFRKCVLLTLLVSLSACGAAPLLQSDKTEPQTTTVIDFRQPALRGASVSAEFVGALAVKEAVYGTGYPDTLRVGEPVTGAFTGKGELQSVYLLTRTDKRSAMLAVFSVAKNLDDNNDSSIGRILAQFVMDEPYQLLLEVKDVNNDAIDELILLQDDFHMGVLVHSVDVISIADMQISIAGQEEFVVQDSCTSDLADRAIRASRLRFETAGIVRDEFIAACIDHGVDTKPVFALVE